MHRIDHCSGGKWDSFKLLFAAVDEHWTPPSRPSSSLETKDLSPEQLQRLLTHGDLCKNSVMAVCMRGHSRDLPPTRIHSYCISRSVSDITHYARILPDCRSSGTGDHTWIWLYFVALENCEECQGTGLETSEGLNHLVIISCAAAWKFEGNTAIWVLGSSPVLVLPLSQPLTPSLLPPSFPHLILFYHKESCLQIMNSLSVSVVLHVKPSEMGFPGDLYVSL